MIMDSAFKRALEKKQGQIDELKEEVRTYLKNRHGSIYIHVGSSPSFLSYCKFSKLSLVDCVLATLKKHGTKIRPIGKKYLELQIEFQEIKALLGIA